MKALITGNWKMNGLAASAAELQAIIAVSEPLASKVDLLICPPATLVAAFATRARGSVVAIGGQDCHAKESGAFTGSGPMINSSNDEISLDGSTRVVELRNGAIDRLIASAVFSEGPERDAARWIIDNQDDDGKYMYDFHRGRQESSDDYNLVRHAGVTMSLYQLVRAGEQRHRAARAARQGAAGDRPVQIGHYCALAETYDRAGVALGVSSLLRWILLGFVVDKARRSATS